MSKKSKLEEDVGRMLTAPEVARILRLDPRTVRKYARALGGLEVLPGRVRFFEHRIRAAAGLTEVITS